MKHNDENKTLTDDVLNKEIDDLMYLDKFHHNHFTDKRPTPEEWKTRRELYISHPHHQDDEDLYDMEKEQWFNDLRVSVYLRDHRNSEEHLEDLKSKLKERIPGYDFDSFHMPTSHDDQSCV